MQQKSVNNAAMESKAYNALKQIEKTSALYADHIYCNQPQLLENENSKKESVNSLKSMLILHLEVVKEQADQLLSKDKLIAKLKQENEELKARLEKYEQRHHHHHHHRSSQQQQHHQQQKRMSSGTTTKNPQTRITTVTSTIDESENNKRCSDTSTAATITTTTTTTITSPTPKRRRIERKTNEKLISSSLTNTTTTPSLNPVSQTEQTTQETPAVTTTTTTEVTATSENSPKKGPRTSFITTTGDYILCDWQKSEAERDADAEPHVRATLEIPSWQILERSFQNTFPPDQSEDMSDDAFLKRHTKFEIDERRRKKWDVQRLREQKQVERLKKRYQKDEYDERDQKSEHKSITSFYPSPDNIMYIQIVEELPVLAFGDPIPALPESDFTLSWLTNTDPRISPSFIKTRFFSKKK